jgi:hypothetical protein
MFLSQKYETSGKLLGLLRILQHHISRNEINNTIQYMNALNVKEIPSNEKTILEEMKIYNATEQE